MGLTRYVDPFLGNGEIDLPTPEGIAASWFFIKAQTGNTHPGPVSPFGMVSVCPYSGAYVTGYGLNAPNSHARPPRHLEEYSASGFTHFQHSGTGAIGYYYNYFRVTPLVGGLGVLGRRWKLEGEEARPGYYAARFAENGIGAELTVSPKAAFHRYHFPEGSEALLAVDFSVGGLDFERMRSRPEEGEVEVLSERSFQGRVLMEGIPVWVYGEVDDAVGCRPFVGVEELVDRSGFSLDQVGGDQVPSFGVVFGFEGKEERSVCLRLGFSLRSAERARENMREVEERSFEEVAEGLRRTWDGYLERVQVEGGSQAQRQVFYSALYHSLIKPCDCGEESPFWEEDGPCYVDFATLWDQYKTMLPLMATLYPERAADALNGLLSLAERLGEFPNALLFCRDFTRCEDQARGLTHHFIADCFNRRIEGVDWQRALGLMVADLRKERNRDFRERGRAHPFTHTLDLADACACTVRLAEGLGEMGIVREFAPLARQWRSAYAPETGRLGASRYYEGGAWNYSFRLLHEMAGRIGLYADEEAFVGDLDRFFGYGQPPVKQPVVPGDRERMEWGFALNRFEGLNNEPDIEVPYAYLYAGRPDRTAEVVRAGMEYMFTTGRGGLPGNDDSGGLSSWYVWNGVGLFPVTGQPLYLIGSPLFDGATLRLGDRRFTIAVDGNGDGNIYVQKASLNGEPLDRAWLSIDEVHGGGRLELVMGPHPSGWARTTRPPSFPT